MSYIDRAMLRLFVMNYGSHLRVSFHDFEGVLKYLIIIIVIIVKGYYYY